MTAPYTVILDPSAVSTNRTQLNLNSGAFSIGGTEAGTGVDWGQSAITTYETEQQVWGNAVADFRVPNRTITIPLMVAADDDTDFETALQQLRQKVSLFQREGGWLLRQRDDGPALYAQVVNATLTLPDVWGEAGDLEPDVSLVLEALPDFFGDEITLDQIHCTGYCDSVLKQSGVQAVIEGDHPGHVRIVVTDTSGTDQNDMLWGFRSRHYDSASTAALFYEAAVLNPTGAVSLAGAYGGSAVQVSATGQAALFNTPALTHQGSYEVYARVYATTSGGHVLPQVRLIWGVGDLTRPVFNDFVPTPGAAAFYILDLGSIRLDPPPIGTYSWLGQVQTSPIGGSTTVTSIDALWFKPLDESAGDVIDEGVPSANLPAELATDGMFTQTTGGPAYRPIDVVTGDLPRIPPSGMEGRPVELLIKPTQGQVNVNPDAGINTFTVQGFYRPVWAFRP